MRRVEKCCIHISLQDGRKTIVCNCVLVFICKYVVEYIHTYVYIYEHVSFYDSVVNHDILSQHSDTGNP